MGEPSAACWIGRHRGRNATPRRQELPTLLCPFGPIGTEPHRVSWNSSRYLTHGTTGASCIPAGMGSCSNAFSSVDLKPHPSSGFDSSNQPSSWRNNYARHLRSLLPCCWCWESPDGIMWLQDGRGKLSYRNKSLPAGHHLHVLNATQPDPLVLPSSLLASLPLRPHPLPTRGVPRGGSPAVPSHDAIACGVSPYPVYDDSRGRAEHQDCHDEDGGQDDKNDDPDVQDVLGEGSGTNRAGDVHPKRETQSSDGAIDPKASTGRPRPASAMCSSQSKQVLAKAPSRRRGISSVL